jgi:hypothetical protein
LGFSLQCSKASNRNYGGLWQFYEDVGGFFACVAVKYWSGCNRILPSVNNMTGSEAKVPEALTPAALVALGAALSAAVYAMVGCTWVSKAAIKEHLRHRRARKIPSGVFLMMSVLNSV